MEPQLKYTAEQLHAILDMLDHVSSAPGIENLRRFSALVDKTEALIAQADQEAPILPDAIQKELNRTGSPPYRGDK